VSDRRIAVIDAHHHLWDPDLANYPWMTDDVAPLRRRFDLEHFEPLLVRSSARSLTGCRL
jgi:L-fuconolactonase